MDALCRSDTLLLIGAGISRWSSVPGWTSLLEELATFCEAFGVDVTYARQQIEKDFGRAAGLLKAAISEENYYRFFRENDALNHPEPSEVHRKLLAFPQSAFLTTNYDNLIEKTWDSLGGRAPLRKVVHKDLGGLYEICAVEAANFVFKCHGDIEEPESVVFTDEDYIDWQHKNSAALETLKTLLGSRRVVAFGYGYQDPNIKWVQDALKSVYGSNTRPIHLVTSEIPQEIAPKYYRDSLGVEITGYSAVGNDHSNLLGLLDELKRQVELRARSKAPPMSADNQQEREAQAFLEHIKEVDTDIRHIVMSLVYWNLGIQLPQLLEILTQRQFSDVQVISSVDVLVGKNGLVRVNDLLLPDPSGYCEAIAFSRIQDVDLLLGEKISGK